MEHIKAYQDVIRKIYFTYQDAICGLELINSRIQGFINEGMKANPRTVAVGGIEIRSVDVENFTSENTWFLSRNNHEILAANKINGDSYITIGQMAICTLYNYWEDYYRERCAMALGYNKNDLKSKLFEDLGMLRNAITHNRGIATEKMKKMVNFKYFSKGDPIIINTQIFNEIVIALLEELERIKDDIVAKQG